MKKIYVSPTIEVLRLNAEMLLAAASPSGDPITKENEINGDPLKPGESIVDGTYAPGTSFWDDWDD